MFFGLNNAPSTFMDLMNRVFKQYVDILNILIYPSIEEEHASHLRIILQTLKDLQLLQSIAFLGHIVSSEQIRVDSQKIEVVKPWPRPTFDTYMTSFLGLAG